MSMPEMSKRAPLGAELVNIALGIWLAVSPFVLVFTQNTALKWNNIAEGIALILVALVGAGNEALQGLTVPLSAWLFASPFILNFTKELTAANSISVAFAAIAAAAVSSGLRLPVKVQDTVSSTH